MTMVTTDELTCFKAYDIRGSLGVELGDSIGAAVAATLEAKNDRFGT
jgi:hypothetical protein